MRRFIVLALGLPALMASAEPIGVLDRLAGAQPQVSVSDQSKVPGQNPFTFCKPTQGSILQLESIDLTPNPPMPGTQLLVRARGTLSQPIMQGANLHLDVKYGVVTLFDQTIDLCDKAKYLNLQCPIQAGSFDISRQLEMPKNIPPGIYSGYADAYTVENTPITCLSAKASFGS